MPRVRIVDRAIRTAGRRILTSAFPAARSSIDAKVRDSWRQIGRQENKKERKAVATGVGWPTQVRVSGILTGMQALDEGRRVDEVAPAERADDVLVQILDEGPLPPIVGDSVPGRRPAAALLPVHGSGRWHCARPS